MEWILGLLVIPILAFFIHYFNVLAFSRVLFWLFALLHKTNPVLLVIVVLFIITSILLFIIKRCVHGQRQETTPNGNSKDR